MEEIKLPALREDLIFDPEPEYQEGKQLFLIIDPIKNNYYRIDYKTLFILKNWHLQFFSKLQKSLQEQNLEINEDDIKRTITFVIENELTVMSFDNIQQALQKQKDYKKNILFTVLRQYLFFRIKLFNPDKFLEYTLPIILKFFSKTYLCLLFFIAIISLFLTVTHWDKFVSAYNYLFNVQGMILLVVSMIIVKLFHELGHAYTSKMYGCHVNNIGIAFLVLFPVLYTDATDSWKIKSPRKRLLIDCSGIISELHLTLWCLFLWHFVGDGVWQTILAYIVTVSLISTLFINLNPLLRFDGYYALTNFLHIDNLQTHGFLFARWKLRKILLGITDSAPIFYKKSTQRIILLYSYVTWIYRFFLFLAIAVFVYLFFFKALGIFLMLAEIYYFILQPIIFELIMYFKTIRANPLNKNIFFSFLGILFIIFLLFYPWQTSLLVPAELVYKYKYDIYIPHDSFALSLPIKNTANIMKDNSMAIFFSPELQYELKQNNNEIELQKLKIRSHLEKGKILGYKQSDVSELIALQSKSMHIQQEINKLKFPAPIQGTINNKSPLTNTQRWYAKDQYIFSLTSSKKWIIKAYVPERDIARIKKVKHATFYPQNLDLEPFEIDLQRINTNANTTLEAPYQASVYGGEIPVFDPQKNQQQDFTLKNGYYQVLFSLNKDNLNIAQILFEQKGKVNIMAERRSIFSQLYTKIVSVIIRESNF